VPPAAPTLTVTDRPAAELRVDALVVPIHAAPGGAALAAGHGLPRRASAHLSSAIASLRLTGALEELTPLAAVPGVAAETVVLAGLGDGSGRSFDPEAVRRGIGAATRSLSGRARVAVCVPGGSTPASVAAAAEGAGLGGYAVTGRRGSSTAPAAVGAVDIVSGSARDPAVRRAVRRASSLAAATAYCRDLVNTPPNLLYPQTFVESVRDRARGTAVTVRVMDEKALARGGFGGIIGVGQGSVRPPRIATMSYSPVGAAASIAFVGKGITFDSGGLCIKSPAAMRTMKQDMSGAAAVAAAVLAIAELGVPVAVTGYLALAENMPGANAQRPGDVVTMRGGTTVEIVDTDAEGRMVLGDALALASEKHPGAIVDIATLAGAQQVALGNRIGAVMANDDALRDTVRAAADEAGEALWPMPLPEQLRDGLESQVADLAHKGDRMGGMLRAGLFLGEFVGVVNGQRIPWAHLDIAGPAFNTSPAHGYTPTGGTGFGVRLLVRLAETYAG